MFFILNFMINIQLFKNITVFINVIHNKFLDQKLSYKTFKTE